MTDEKTANDELADDEALSAEWDALNGKSETKKEEPKAEVKKEEPVKEASPEVKEETPPVTASAKTPEELVAEAKHKEESKLGRKLHSLSERLAQAEAKLAAAPVKTETPEVVTTPEDVMNVLRARSEDAQREQQQYEANYLKQVQQLKTGEDEEELYDEVVAEITSEKSPFNKRYSDNAFADARINYAEAKVAVLKKRYSETKSPVPKRDTAGAPPVQPAAMATTEAKKSTVLPPLDKDAMDYVNYLRSQGETDESIAEVLAR